jgi:hypothetical protein
MSNYQKQKEAILKWREANIDEYRLYQKTYAKEHYQEKFKDKKKLYYEANKEKKQQYYLKRKQLKADMEEFMNILLD